MKRRRRRKRKGKKNTEDRQRERERETERKRKNDGKSEKIVIQNLKFKNSRGEKMPTGNGFTTRKTY